MCERVRAERVVPNLNKPENMFNLIDEFNTDSKVLTVYTVRRSGGGGETACRDFFVLLHVLVPQMRRDIVQVIQLVRVERIKRRVADRMVDTLVPLVM